MVLEHPGASAAQPLKVTAVKPGAADAREVHQVTITFNQPVVPLGDFEQLAKGLPVGITPSLPCHWRWLNRRTLACELDEPLPGSNAYRVRIEAGFKAMGGQVLEQAHETTFTTEKWRLVNRRPRWLTPDRPVFYLAFNQPMDLGTLNGDHRSTCGPARFEAVPEAEALEQALGPGRTYRMQFDGPLGLDRRCEVLIPSKARSRLGPEPGMQARVGFRTYPEFAIRSVGCQYGVRRTGPFSEPVGIKGCDPDTAVRVEFNTPVLSEDLAGKISVTPFFGWEEGAYGSPEYLSQNPGREISTVYLHPPLLPGSRHRIRFVELKDRFGRPLSGADEVNVETLDARPSLGLGGGYAVMEKAGPRDVPYTARNIGRFTLDYHASGRAEDAGLWRAFTDSERACWGGEQEEAKGDAYPMQSRDIETGVALNQPERRPLDLKSLDPSFDHGMFFGRVNTATRLEGADTMEWTMPCKAFFMVITDLGIMAKVGFYDSGVWVHSITSGKPLEGVRVSFRDEKKTLAESVTDKNGFARLDGAINWDPERKLQNARFGDSPLFVVAETGDDLAVLPFSEGTRGIGNYEFSTPGGYVSGAQLRASGNHIVHAITDRPLYQPGQVVKVKLFARHWEPRTFGLKPAEKMTLVAKDAMGKTIHEETLTLSGFGTASATFKLGQAAPLGHYSVQAKIGSWQRGIGGFQVQEFQLPPFKVDVEAEKPARAVGESATFNARALYHFGGALAEAKGTYHAVFQESVWRPKEDEWAGFSFGDPISINIEGWDRPRTLRRLVLESGELVTDKEGRATHAVPLADTEIRSYGHLSFEARFQDDRGRNIANSAGLQVFYGDFEVGLRKKKWTYAAGETLSPEAVLLAPDEKPVPGQSVTLHLVHRRYNTVRVLGAGNYFSYQTNTRDEVVDRCEFVSENAPKGCALKARAAGAHYLVAEATDRQGRIARASLHVYVTGAEYVGWRRENHDRIDLVPDKPSHKVGETLELLVKNPYESVDAIFTLERFGILKKFRRRLTQGAEIVRIPLDRRDYAPGFNVSVHLIQGRTSEELKDGVDLGKPAFKMGLARITVIDPDSELKITAASDHEGYQPGETVKVDITVEPPDGTERPAELLVAVVDERILQLAGDSDSRYDLWRRFYQMPYGDVATSQMLTGLLGRRHYGKKGAPSGGDGGGVALRKDFLPLAYWNPSLVTDDKGRASVTFKAPDNLTRWRVLVVAADKAHRFGKGSASFQVSKKLMIEPALPSFLTAGDKFVGRVSVFNRTGKDSAVKGRLGLENGALHSPAAQEVAVKDQEKGIFEWTLTAPEDETETRLTVSAEAGAHRDAARYTLPVRPYLSPETFAIHGSTEEASVEVPLDIPANIRVRLSTAGVILSPTIVSHLDDVFRYAFDYPYTCWEQTLVRALMLHHFMKLEKYLSLPAPAKPPAEWIQELLALMPRYQAPGGGMGYWKSDARTVDPYLSVFTALGLLWLEDDGVPVPEEPKKKLQRWVRGYLKGTEKVAVKYNASTRHTVRAMAAYVVGRLGDDATPSINLLYGEREKLDLFGKSFLLRAAAAMPATARVARALGDEIAATADHTSGKVQFQEISDDGLERILHSPTRSNCNLLEAFLENEGDGSLVEPLARWVIATRRAGRWNNTQENLYCLRAIARYAQAYEKTPPKFTIKGSVLEVPVGPMRFEGFKAPPAQKQIPIDERWIGKEGAVRLARKGAGRAYYTARLRLVPEAVRPDAVNAGLKVERRYFIKGADGTWQPAGDTVTARRGDLLRVSLTVSAPATRTQVALADSLPAGFEPLNTALASTSRVDAADEGVDNDFYWLDGGWWERYFSGGFYHRDMRLAGPHYFADFLESGEYRIDYIAQAIATGEFRAAPAVVEEMYTPEVYGKSRPARFIVED